MCPHSHPEVCVTVIILMSVSYFQGGSPSEVGRCEGWGCDLWTGASVAMCSLQCPSGCHHMHPDGREVLPSLSFHRETTAGGAFDSCHSILDSCQKDLSKHNIQSRLAITRLAITRIGYNAVGRGTRISAARGKMGATANNNAVTNCHLFLWNPHVCLVQVYLETI